MTPNVAVVHINFPHGPNFRLWLPLFLLWIPAILLAPIILLALLIGCLISGVRFWQTIAAFWALLCSLPGTDVRVATEGNRVLVRIL
ncbi:hypothetical protein P8935_13000 [Telmatobacter sp. DSM 110680]|uniref:Uncharacterized protein n=1 Tax=Telmatobacter sp. DSM 110680 TaxID=3036704 RepID=A0AAU7DDS9_9BACT